MIPAFVVFLYLGVVFVIGLFAGRASGRQPDAEDFFLAERSLGPAVFVLFAVQEVLIVPYIVIAVIGGGTTLRAVSGGLVPFWIGGGVVSAVVMGYVLFGGMRGTAWVNAFQNLLFLSFDAIAVAVIAAGRMGGFRQAVESMLASPATAPLLTRERVSPLSFFSYTFIPLSSVAFPLLMVIVSRCTPASRPAGATLARYF